VLLYERAISPIPSSGETPVLRSAISRLLSAVVRSLIAATLLLVGGRAMAQAPIIVTGVSSSIGASRGDQTRGWLAFGVKNTTTQSQSVHVQGDCGAANQYDDWSYDSDFGTYVDDGCPAVNSTATIAAGQTLTVSSAIGFDPTGLYDDRVTLTVYPTGNAGAAFAGVARVTYGRDVLAAQFLTSSTSTSYTPQVSPKTGSATVPNGSTSAQIVTVNNVGNTTANYSLAATCSGFVTACGINNTTTSTTTLTVGAGSSAMTSLNYATGTSGGTGTARLTVTAPASSTGLVQADTSTITVAPAPPSLAPVIAITPLTGTVFTTSSTGQIRIDYCDGDDPIIQRTVTWQGQTLADNFTATSRSGCLMAGYSIYSLTLLPWQQNLVVTARDFAGHVATSTTSFTYSAPLSGFRPAVITSSDWHRLSSQGSVAAADTFTVQNQSGYALAYSIAALCGGTSTLTNCVANKGSVSLAAGASSNVVVNYTRSGALDHSDTLKLAATYTSPLGGVIADTGEKVVIALSVEAAPTIVAAARVTELPWGSIVTEFFTLTNPNVAPETFTLAATPTNGYLVNGSPGATPPWTITLSPNQSLPIPIGVGTPSAGSVTGTITLAASYVNIAGTPLSASAATSMVTASTGSSSTKVIAVAPKNSRTIPQSVPTSVRFTITNTSSSSATVDYRVVCLGPAIVSCGALARTQWQIGADGSDSLSVIATPTATVGQTGTVKFIATSGGLADTGFVDVTIGASAGPVTISTARQLNPGGSVARDDCLTIAAGDDAAYECGDLRLVHPLPTTTTLNKARTPALIYTSAHARPVNLVQTDVTIDNADPSLNGVCVRQIKATVRFTATDASETTLPWNGPCGQMASRRIAIPVDARAHSHLTGVYHYTVEVQALAPGWPTATDTTGVMAVVDRSQSPFGSGWWLDGLEQLVALPHDSLLWIGGDGSTRVYTKQGTDTFVVRPTLDRPDSILALRTGSTITEYRRKLRNGAYVSFDGHFRHVATVNTLGHTTAFFWRAPDSALLDSIALPVPNGGPRRVYAFSYTSGLLTSVVAPAGSNGSRTTTLSRTAGDLSIVDPGLTAGVHYFADGSDRIVVRTSRLGDGTRYDYDPTSGVLTRSALNMSRVTNPGDSIHWAFCPAEAAGAASCADSLVDPAAVRTLVDGPRLDVPDTTAFYLTRFGAPRRIIDALGHETRIERTDTLWPMLATQVVDPRGHAVLASYDSLRGLLLSTTDLNPNAPSLGVTTGNAITNYTWHPRWDRAVEILSPMNLTSHIVYDDATGNRLEQSVGSTHTNRTTFGYDDPLTRLVTKITTTQSAAPTRLVYDGLGNLTTVTTPKGFVTTTRRDAAGRDSIITSPIDSAQTQFRTQIHAYDANDRLKSSLESAKSGSIVQTIQVVNDYDDEGQLKSVSRVATPDVAGVGTLITDYTFDPAGRKLTERDRTAPENQVARWHYDQAGNVFQIDTKAFRFITMRYDTLNRLSHRTIPRVGDFYGSLDDTQDFRYDEVGNLLTAKSPYAEVVRTYTLGGGIEGDSLAIRATDTSATGMAHGYRLVNHYDLAGRRISQDQPSNLLWVSAGSGAAGSSNFYGYDLQSGALETVTDQRGNTFRYHYNAAGLLESLTMPGGITETHVYDDDSREVHRLEVGSMGAIHDDYITRDAAGKILGAGVKGLATTGGSGNFTYAGLGSVIESSLDFFDFEKLSLTTDAFGHTISKKQSGTESDPDTKLYQYTYQTNSNRLSQITGQLGNTGTDVLTHSYDATGDLTGQTYAQTTPKLFGEGTTGPSHVDASWSIVMGYDAAGRLLTTNRTTVNDGTNWQNDLSRRRTAAAVNTGYGAYEEYRYDPLGRRVWKRTHRDNYCTDEARAQTKYQAECASAITVTMWDGDQVLYEIRAAAAAGLTASQLEHNIESPVGSGSPFGQFSATTYLHGVGIDRPLEMTRAGEVVVFHASWRGAIDATTNTVGQFSTCGQSTSGSCILVKWPGQEMGLTYTRPYTAVAAVPWYGDLSQGQLDASGKMYMRNRYYDPGTGRFTQEDPIGLAGGTNLYGFGGGDQVNFSDPFGLAHCPTPCAAAAGGTVVSAAGGAAAASALVSATSNSEVVASGIDAAIDYLKDKLQVKFVTYTRQGPTGAVYSGRARGVGNPQAIVNARARSHPSRLDGFGPPLVDRWATGVEGYVAIRGREQQLIDAHGRAQSEQGTSANLIRGVSRLTFPLFDAAAIAMFGPPPGRQAP
jgi:RHS repeat-associated protein